MLHLDAERRWLRALAATGAALALACTISARAFCATPPPAGAPEAGVWVWYRSGEGCPDGAAFIGLLQRFGRVASLAGVGDRVDFVVTMAYAARESSGRLERQSSERTVAIRDVAAASCLEVAEVLALSLDLALQPGAEPQPSTPAAPDRSAGWVRRVGVQGTFETGLAHALLPGAALFFELGPALQAWSLRLSLRGAYGERAAAVALEMGLLASRLEACWAWGWADVALGPCAGVDLGLALAESPSDGGQGDVGFWGGADSHARATWQISRPVALEAQVGVLVPFVRYQFRALTGEEVSDSAALGVAAALGVSFRF